VPTALRHVWPASTSHNKGELGLGPRSAKGADLSSAGGGIAALRFDVDAVNWSWNLRTGRDIGGLLSLTMVVAIGLTGCGAQTPTSRTGATTPPVASAAPPTPCPGSPPSGTTVTPPSPLPALGDDLNLPGPPCVARYEGVADVRGLTTLNMTAGRIMPGEPYFAPTLLKGTAGQSLKLHIVNATPSLHNISVPGEGINVDIGTDGGTVDVVVTFPARGAIVYICRFHDLDGQAGELLAVPD
jgi:hypothetical protein